MTATAKDYASALLACVETSADLQRVYMTDVRFHELVTRARIEAKEGEPARRIFGVPVVENSALTAMGPIVAGAWCQRRPGCLKPDGHEGDCWPNVAPPISPTGHGP